MAVGVVASSLVAGGLAAIEPFVALAAAAFGAAVVVSLLSPFHGLLLWVAALGIQVYHPLSPVPRFAPADLLLIPIVVGGLMTARATSRRWHGMSATSLWLVALVLAFGLSHLVSVLVSGGLTSWALLQKDLGLVVMITGYFIVVTLVTDRERLIKTIRWFVVSASVLNVIAVSGALALMLFDIPNFLLYEMSTLRLVGFLLNPSSYGAFLLVVLALQLAFFLRRSDLLGIPRPFQALNSVLLLFGIALTLSRSTWFACAVVLMIFALRRFSFGKALLLGGLALTVVAIVTTVVEPELLRAAGELARDPRTLLDRFALNEAALDLWASGPGTVLLGIGIGTFLENAPQLVGEPLVIHNTYLWMLVEMGIFGLVAFVGLAKTAFGNARRASLSRSPDSALALGVYAGLAGLLAWMLLNEGLYQRPLWLLFALAHLLGSPRGGTTPAPR